MKFVSTLLLVLFANYLSAQQLSENYEISRSIGYKQNDYLDVNTDGILDLVTLGLDDFSYYLGNGDGTFGMKKLIRDTLSVGAAQTVNFDYSDFNNDGKIDFVVYSGVSNAVEVFLNNVSGFNKVVLQNVSPYIKSVFCLDMTGDGLEDVLTGHYIGQGAIPEWIQIYVNQGGGNFASGTTLVTNVSVNDIFKLQDMDNDGDEDIVKRNVGTPTSVTIIKNMGTTFTSGMYYGVIGKTFTEFDILDVDNDGFKDIVVPFYNSPTSIHWWKNLGNANFMTGYDITVPTRANCVDITTSDVDLDSYLDVVMTTANMVYWYKNTSGIFQVIDTLATTQFYTFVTSDIDDLDGDLLPDLNTVDDYGSSVYINSGSAQFSIGDRITQMPKDPIFVDIKDIDNDGIKDVIYSTGFGPSFIKDIVWHKSDGNNHFNEETVILRNFIDIMGYEVEDVDNDGDNDIVMGCTSCSINSVTYTNRLIVMRNNGTGNFTSVSNLGLSKARFIQVVDIDNDSDKDIVAVSALISGFNTVKIFWNNGASYTEQIIYNGTVSKEAVFVADMNGDSKKDLVIKTTLGSGFPGFEIWFNNGSNSFPTSTPYLRRNFQICVRDFDNDGDSDVMKSYTYGSLNEGIMLLKNNGAGLFTDSVSLEYFVPGVSNSKYLYPFDFDNDLDLDLFTLESDSITYFKNMGGGNFAPKALVQTGIWLVSDLALGNIDGDPFKEIVTGSEGHDQVMTVTYANVANTPILNVSNDTVCAGSTIQIVVANNTALNLNTTWALYEGSIGNSPNQLSTTGTFNVSVDSTTTYFICGYGGVSLNGNIQETTVFVNQSSWEESASACGSYNWSVNGTTYTMSGIYIETLTSMQGCDSIRILNLTITPLTIIGETLSVCNSYYWPASGITYNSSGLYTLVFAGSNGCDSVLTLDLTIHSPSSGIAVEAACDSYTWIDGVNYTASTTAPTWTLTNALGCDSVIMLDLTIYPSTASTIIDTAMDSYTLNGQNYTLSGTYVQVIPNAIGCDSTISLELTIYYSLVEEFQLASFSVSPNPSNGDLHIKWDEESINVKDLKLLDNSGRVVKDLGIENQYQDLSALVSGVYYIKIVSKQGNYFLKWVRY
jgi:hypothetical protein